jgi:hypothetical protein
MTHGPLVAMRTFAAPRTRERGCQDGGVHKSKPEPGSPTTRAAVVLRPGEDRCEVLLASGTALVEYAAPFRPRAKSLTPGHLVAVTTTPDAAAFIIWRWFDAVVLEQSAEQVRLWEPAHGEVMGHPRNAQYRYPLGTRAYLSAGLPGAEWWVEGPVGSLEDADVQLDPVHEFYTEHDLWSSLT